MFTCTPVVMLLLMAATFGGLGDSPIDIPEVRQMKRRIARNLLIALILGGLGFAVHILWWIALIVFVLWLVGPNSRSFPPDGAHSRLRQVGRA